MKRKRNKLEVNAQSNFEITESKDEEEIMLLFREIMVGLELKLDSSYTTNSRNIPQPPQSKEIREQPMFQLMLRITKSKDDEEKTQFLFSEEMIELKNFGKLPKPVYSVILQYLVATRAHWSYLRCCKAIVDAYTPEVFLSHMNALQSLHTNTFDFMLYIDDYQTFYKQLLQWSVGRFGDDPDVFTTSLLSIGLPQAHRSLIVMGAHAGLPPLFVNDPEYIHIQQQGISIQRYRIAQSAATPLVAQYNYHTKLFSYSTFQCKPTKETVTVNIIEEGKYTINLPQFMVTRNTSENTVKWKMEMLSRYTIWTINSSRASDIYPRYVNTNYRLLHIAFVHPEEPTEWILSYVYHPQKFRFLTVLNSVLDFRLHSIVRKIGQHVNHYNFHENHTFTILLEVGQNQPVNHIGEWVLEKILFTDGSWVPVLQN